MPENTYLLASLNFLHLPSFDLIFTTLLVELQSNFQSVVQYCMTISSNYQRILLTDYR